jgi:electron transport complex protein RnfG
MSGTISPAAPIWPLYRAFVGFGALAAALVAIAWQMTAPTIAAKRLAAKEALVREVIPRATAVRGLRWDGSLVAAVPAEAELWAGYDAADHLLGVAFESSAMGYQDQVRVLVAYSPSGQALLGLRVLESRETPGLGDRVGKDEAFLSAWVDRVVTFDAGGTPRGFDLAGREAATELWQIDGISGATISSRAVVAAVNRGVATWVPRTREMPAPEPGGPS